MNLQLDYGLQATGGLEFARANAIAGQGLPRTFGSVLADLAHQTYPAWTLQLAVSYPLGLGRDEATLARTSLQRQQAEATLKAA